jgi:hypothetical protein
MSVCTAPSSQTSLDLLQCEDTLSAGKRPLLSQGCQCDQPAGELFCLCLASVKIGLRTSLAIDHHSTDIIPTTVLHLDIHLVHHLGDKTGSRNSAASTTPRSSPYEQRRTMPKKLSRQ